jgi:hypothetical protein
MGLTKYGLAVGIGYHFGRPDGRRQLLWLRQQIIGLARRPAVRNLRERGWDIAGECALAACNVAARKLRGTSKVAAATTRSPADSGAPTGFGGRTVTEDSQAAITGMAPPGPRRAGGADGSPSHSAVTPSSRRPASDQDRPPHHASPLLDYLSVTRHRLDTASARRL